MASKISQGERLLMIRDYLFSHSNENDWVTSKEIIEHLEHNNVFVDRKTVLSDLSNLRDYYGEKIECNQRKGYHVKEQQFSPSDLRLIIDAVQSAKFITEKEALNITNKIKELADIKTRPSLERKSYVNERIRNMRESIVKKADVIHQAFAEDIKISFKYAHYKPAKMSIDVERAYTKKGEDIIVSPFALYWDNGNYYLCAYLSETNKFRYFRVDRMDNIELVQEFRDGKEEFGKIELENKAYKIFDMYGGKNAKVTLKGINKVADQVIDQFGANTRLVGTDDYHFTANVNVEVSPTFFAWVSTFGKQLRIINPPEVVEEMKEFVGKVNEIYE